MNRPVSITSAEVLPADYTVPAELARELRRADEFIQMAVISGSAAVAAAAGGELRPEEVGVFIGTAFGPLETNFESLGSLIDDGEGQISPTLFSHSVYNAAAGYVARLLGIQGPALTITNYGWPFLIALEEGRMAVATGRIERALVIGVETYSELLADAYRRSYGVSEVPWRRSAVAWVLEPGTAARRVCRLVKVSVSESDSDPADFLTRKGEILEAAGGDTAELDRHPMAYAEALTRSVSRSGPGSWRLAAPFGQAVIDIDG